MSYTMRPLLYFGCPWVHLRLDAHAIRFCPGKGWVIEWYPRAEPRRP